jgi:hypothetical protein
MEEYGGDKEESKEVEFIHISTAAFAQLVCNRKKGLILPDDVVLIDCAGLPVCWSTGGIPATFYPQMPCFGPLVVFVCQYTT